MKIKHAIVSVSMVLMCCTGFAFAGTEQGEYFISPMVGGHIFEGNQHLEHSPTFGLGIGYQFAKNLGVESFVNWTNSDSEPGTTDVDVYPFRLDAYYNILANNKIEPYIAAGIGVISYNPEGSDSEHDFMVNYGVGVKYFLTEKIALRGDVRHLITFDDNYNQLLYTVGLSFVFGGNKPAPAPVAAKKIEEPVAKPAPAPVVVEPAPVVEKKAEVVEEPAKEVKDSDGDGVIDDNDKCPNTPVGAKVDARGCWVINGLQFESNKSVIKRQSYKELENVLVVMKKNPAMKLEIQGYTDNKGSADKNKVLSEKRAMAVKKYFESKGIKKDRLSAKGYGPDSPVATNDTAEGRAENRRVELKPVM
jgi:OOP family OmpA-OmpF porin